MSPLENRKDPKRYNTMVPIEFMDKNKTKGTMINVAKGGILVVCKKLQAVNSYVKLRILPPDSPPIVFVGKVARHSQVLDGTAMGIQSMEMDMENKTRWIAYVNSLSRQTQPVQSSTPTPPQTGNFTTEISIYEIKSSNHEQSQPQKLPTDIENESQFLLRFKTKDRALRFFPKNWRKDDFFITTNIQKKKGDRITIRMTHPEAKADLLLLAEVGGYGQNPQQPEKTGIFFRILDYNSKIESDIRQFLLLK